MKTYFVSRTKSLGNAYALLNQLSSRGFELFEIAPIAGGAHLIMFSVEEAAACLDKIKDLQEDLQKFCEFQQTVSLSDDVIESYLSLRDVPLKQDLLVLEHDFLGALFEVAQKLHSEGLDLLDLRFAKGYKQKAHAFFTQANPASRVSEQVSELKKKGFEVTYLSELSAGVRSLFEHVNDNSQ